MGFWEKFKNKYIEIKNKCTNIIEYTNINKYYIENDTNYVIKIIDENGKRFLDPNTWQYIDINNYDDFNINLTLIVNNHKNYKIDINSTNFRKDYNKTSILFKDFYRKLFVKSRIKESLL